jgi:hypothetical protein
MKRTRRSPAQIIGKLRDADHEISRRIVVLEATAPSQA